MKFRDFENVKVCICRSTEGLSFLEREIERIGEDLDIIDLQYSTCTYVDQCSYVDHDPTIEYSALVLYREKK